MSRDNGNSNAASGWRWTIGILLTIQGAVLGWIVVEQQELRRQIYEGSDRSTRTLLEERTQTWVPVIIENRADNIRQDRELDQLKYQVQQLERRR